MNQNTDPKQTLEQLPCGSLFTDAYGTVGLKTEYRTEKGAIEAFIIGSGEMYWGGTTDPEKQRSLEVWAINASELAALSLRQVVKEELEAFFNKNKFNKALIDEQDIETLNLSVRLYNVLKGAKINTVGQAKSITWISFKRIRNAGEKLWNELQSVLDSVE